MSNSTLHVAIDLGSESVKVVYAYQDKAGKLQYGKMEINGEPYPGMVSYSAFSEKWLIGDDIESLPEFSYDTLIRIKDMLSLLIPIKVKGEGGTTHIDNTSFYNEQKYFPKFFFPLKRKSEPDLSVAIEKEQTFIANTTPKELCKLFFDKLFSELITPRIKKLFADQKHLTDTRYIAIYPSKANRAYITELERLISSAAKVKNVHTIAAPKAVAVGAYHMGILPPNSAALLADIGERDISVTKVYVGSFGGDVSVNIDGADGHNPPDEIGGEDFDEALTTLIENKSLSREILGSGSGGGTDEHGTYRQQYLLMRHIKQIKACFSIPDKEYNAVFSSGVPIQLQKDVMVELAITKDEYKKTLFDTNDSVGSQIANYLSTELENPADENVQTVILTGGSAAAFNLRAFLIDAVGKSKNVAFKVFDSKDGEFSGAYAAAYGAAIVAPANITLRLHSALTYGTWVDAKDAHGNYCKKLKVLLNCGDVIPEDGCSKFTTCRSKRNTVEGDEFFSYPNPVYESKPLLVGDPGSQLRRDAIASGLKVVSGGDGKGKIYFMKKNSSGKYVNFEGFGNVGYLYFREGFQIDGDGHAHPYVEIDSETNSSHPEFNGVIARCEGLDDFDVTE